MLDVGDDQLLVLLLVIEAEDDDIGKLGQAVVGIWRISRRQAALTWSR